MLVEVTAEFDKGEVKLENLFNGDKAIIFYIFR